MRLLIIFPNATNVAVISNAVPILAGIARKKNWEIHYFDTYNYENERYISREKEKDKNAGFKPGLFAQPTINKKFDQIVPDLQEKIDKIKPHLIAITALSPEYTFLLKFFKEIKIPSISKVVIGGLHATLMGDEVIKTGLFDLVALGSEGEETFNEILTNIENNKDIKNIKGTYYFDRKTNEIIKNDKRPLLSPEKLWAVDSDYSFYNEIYFDRPFDGKKIRRYEMEISRGCPFNCKYCGNSAIKAFNRGLGKYVKVRPIESSIRQMKNVLNKFKIDIFCFQDECFLSHPMNWLSNYMEAYKKEINKPYIFMTRAETVTEKKVQLLLKFDIPFQASDLIKVLASSEFGASFNTIISLEIGWVI